MRRRTRSKRGAGAAFGLATVLALCAGSPQTLAQGPTPDGEAPNFEALWEDARRWARETNASPQDCVVSLRFEPGTRKLQKGYAATCEEAYRSPYYPWPEPSLPGARYSALDVLRYAQEAGPKYLRRATVSEAEAFEACGVVVGFTGDGRGAEAIECYWPQTNVMGQRANTELVATTSHGRHVSRLYERLAHLRDRRFREMGARLPHPDATVQIEGKVVAREAARISVRGRALPLTGTPLTAPGVLTSDADIVVEYPDDDALRPGYYFGGEHCFQSKRERDTGSGSRTTEWIYGPCALEADEYWVFEQYPPGKRTLVHGPYRQYGQCDADRRKLKVARPGVVEGHCSSKSRAALRMVQDGTLIRPADAPSIE